MARKCDICGRGPMRGNNVSHANNRTKKVFHVNLQKVRVIRNKRTQKLKVCTRCIRSNAVEKKIK